MAQEKPEVPEDTISVGDTQNMLADRTREILKAADLRIRELTDLTIAYTAGKMTPREASEAYYRHEDKWGEVLPGVASDIRGMSDKEIVAEMDKSFAGDMQNARRAHVGRLEKQRRPGRTDIAP
jgi:hypothetical protein